MNRAVPISLMLLVAATAGCRTPASTAPSLAPRAGESIDPRVPVESAVDTRPADPALIARLAALVAQAAAGERTFRAAAADAQRLAAGAGAPQSESWVVAQQALSAAVAARAQTTRALGDIDAVAAEALAERGGLAPADLAAIEAAAAEVSALSRRQAETIDSIAARLRG
jgi:hypothetical protein